MTSTPFYLGAKKHKLEFDCDSLAEGEYDERCNNEKKTGKKVIKPSHIKGSMKKQISKD